ncbi:MAG: methionine adenosyltransferase [Myxococcota bacterium]
MELTLRALEAPPMDERRVEVVERKGIGHPDSLCDAVAEALSLAYSRHALARFGAIPHHNVDKALLRAGRTAPRFGGGEVIEPMEITIAGRATLHVGSETLPIEALAQESAARALEARLPGFDVVRHARVHCRVGPGAVELVDLFGRGAERPLANDTSIGCGHAPLSELERIVSEVERAISGAAGRALPGAGTDVKVMGLRVEDRISLQVACAGRAPALADAAAYRAMREAVARRASDVARGLTRRSVDVHVNSADDDTRDVYYLTVTGTSAEMGDDGQAGRGNRANGLITPGRPMTLESVAGKNPTTHVGKLYNLTAGLLAHALVTEIAAVQEAECLLVSRVGHPIDDPPLVDVRLRCAPGAGAGTERQAEALARREVAAIPGLWRELLEGRVALDRWPLRVA